MYRTIRLWHDNDIIHIDNGGGQPEITTATSWDTMGTSDVNYWKAARMFVMDHFGEGELLCINCGSDFLGKRRPDEWHFQFNESLPIISQLED